MANENFTLVGRVVHHTARPRFSITMAPREDGGWDGGDLTWLDQPAADARALARLMREVGDFFAANVRRDWLQETVIARAEELGLTAYALAKATGGAVSEDHAKDYLSRRKSMGSHKLQHVLRALGLHLNPTREAP